MFGLIRKKLNLLVFFRKGIVMNSETVVSIVFGITQIAQGIIILLINRRFDSRLHQMRKDFEFQINIAERKDRYRLAALDKRLETHQEAYALARKMIQTLHSNSEEKHEIIRKVEEFWNRQCLFLTNETRLSFRNAFSDYSIYHIYMDRLKAEKNEESKKDLFAAFDRISGLLSKIEKGVDIEAMSTEISTIDGKEITPYGIGDKNKDKL
jgi:hypothetical protein